MAITLNIGLNNNRHSTQRSAIQTALVLIGETNVRDWKVVDVAHDNAVDREDTLVVDLYVDIEPGRMMIVANALGQDCIAYLNDSGEHDIGLLIGPRPYDKFEHRFFRLIDGSIPEPEREDGPATMGERLMPGCRCGAASRGDFERCRCD